MSYDDWISIIQQELLRSWEHPDTQEIYTFLSNGKRLIKDKERANFIEFDYSISIEEEASYLAYSDNKFLVKEIGKSDSARYYFVLEDLNGRMLRFMHLY